MANVPKTAAHRTVSDNLPARTQSVENLTDGLQTAIIGGVVVRTPVSRVSF